MQVRMWEASEARQSVASSQYEYTCIKLHNVRELSNVKIWNFAHIFIPTIYNENVKMSGERGETKRNELAK